MGFNCEIQTDTQFIGKQKPCFVEYEKEYFLNKFKNKDGKLYCFHNVIEIKSNDELIKIFDDDEIHIIETHCSYKVHLISIPEKSSLITTTRYHTGFPLHINDKLRQACFLLTIPGVEKR